MGRKKEESKSTSTSPTAKGRDAGHGAASESAASLLGRLSNQGTPVYLLMVCTADAVAIARAARAEGLVVAEFDSLGPKPAKPDERPTSPVN